MRTAEQLRQRHEAEGRSPEAVIRLWFEAAFLYTQDEAAGRDAIRHLTLPLRDDPDWDRRPSNLTFRDRMRTQAHIFRSYAVGATPENGYTMDPSDFELAVERSASDPRGRGWALALRSSGADSPRVVYLRKSTTTGLYYVDNFSNVYVGVRPPREPGAEEFV